MAEDNLNTAAGCRLAIGSKLAADTEAGYKADTYVDVGEIEDLGESPSTATKRLLPARSLALRDSITKQRQ